MYWEVSTLIDEPEGTLDYNQIHLSSWVLLWRSNTRMQGLVGAISLSEIWKDIEVTKDSTPRTSTEKRSWKAESFSALWVYEIDTRLKG
jgi:hypothetical protein